MIAARPRVLIVDDDAVSLAFLLATVERCGCEAVGAADAAAVTSRLQVEHADLLMIDRRMPGIDGPTLLRELRALGIQAPAVATSAELDPAATAALLRAGFADALLKPANLATIRRLLRRFVTPVETVPEPCAIAIESAESTALLDDAAALIAIGGDRIALRALRALFVNELDDAASVTADPADAEQRRAVIERLHRMRASCRICGASALDRAARQYERALREDSNDVAPARAAFLQTCTATRQALAAVP
jgi:CheY-like chemotaxis protein/HPt (histidine-containing phosphotransfer) domain-containing protein